MARYRLLVRRTALALLAAAVLVAPACKRRAGTGACTSGSLSAVHPAVTVDLAAEVREARLAVVGSSFLVVWSAGSATDSDLYARAVDANGVMISNVARLTNITGRSQHPRLALGAGGLGLAWQDDRLGRLDVFAAVLGSSFGPVLGHAFVAPSFDPAQDPIPAIASVGTGFRLVWNGRGPDAHDHLYVQGMGQDGLAAGSAFPLVADLSDRATPPEVASSGTQFAIVDSEARVGAVVPPDVFAYLVSGTGGVTSQRFSPASPAFEPAIAVDGDAAAVVWCDAGPTANTIFFGAFAPTGVLEPQRQLSPDGEDACDARIVAGAGFFLAAWNRLDPSGDRQLIFESVRANGIPDAPAKSIGAATWSDSAVARLEGPDVAWNGRVAGVSWVEQGRVRFQPLECTLGDFATPSPTATP